MTVSPASRRLAGLVLLAAAALVALGCRGPAAGPLGSAFRPQLRGFAPPPDVAHGAAADLARAALVSDAEDYDAAFRRLENIETVLRAFDEQPTGLEPVSIDLRNATLDDRRAYRAASEDLLDRDDLDDDLRERLELFRADDPLTLAGKRIRDAWMIDIARAFNTLAEPIGQSMMTMKLAPYRLGRSLLNYAIQVYTRESFSLQRRQALAHWKEFLERNPEAPEAEEVEPKVRSAQQRWAMHQRDRALKAARLAMETDRWRLALVYADRALRYVPEDRDASELREEAADRLLEIRDAQRRSLDAGQPDLLALMPAEQRTLAVAMLAPGGDLDAAAEALLAADPEGPLADEARFAKATALGEAGRDEEMWELLEDLADEDDEDSNMSRHARALVNNPEINTWRAFTEARRRSYWDRAAWVFLGPFYRGPGDMGLPSHMEWVVAAPSIAESVMGTPMRLINVPWAKSLPQSRVAATLARRHLERHPDDSRADDAREWLQGYEKKRGNWIGTLELEEVKPDADLAKLAEMREKAAQQYLEAAVREPNVGLRIGMYQRLNTIYPGSRAAYLAGELARTESQEVTPQRIRLSRGFLEENPDVAGPNGLALRPELLDDDPMNSELHPMGVSFLGARAVEVAYLSETGDEKDPPLWVREEIGEDHLARTVSLVEEASYRNMLVDPLNDVQADAQRDVFFERARLGLADDVDRRPGSISTYHYRGVKERYGMVRSREGILPFDIVVQGNLHTLSLGAFPRMREPRETPDAMLYK